MTMKRITTAILLGAATAMALAPLLACEDDTTINSAFKDAGADEGGEGGEGGKSEAGPTSEGGPGNEAGSADEAGLTDAADDGG
jgi:hypothetical protein